METTLHRQLKALYSDDESQQEVTVDGFRIDAVVDGRLIEIQQSGLAAIRNKVRKLLQTHDVLVVKPLAARKYLITRSRKKGKITSSRYSPLRQTLYSVFQEFVHFSDVFPHPRLTLEIILTEQEEHRISAQKKRWNGKNYQVEDRLLREIQQRIPLNSIADLVALLPESLAETFSTEDIARDAGIPRWLAQKMAYTLRKTGATVPVDKQGNSLLYRIADVARDVDRAA